MRDILVTLLFFGALPFVLSRPYVGILLWSWVSYMNPHRLAWGFATTIPFAQIVAIVTFVSLLFNREKKTFPVDGLIVVWFLYIAWITFTTTQAIHIEGALILYDKAIKILLMTIVTIVVIRDQKRIDYLVWVICLSIGYYSIKGGIFTILTAGQWRVYGPTGSFIEENNSLAVATLMIIPLMAYLRTTVTQWWLRHGLLAAIFLSLISAVGSQSRGALVAIIALGAYFWWQSKYKFGSAALIICIALFTFNFMPQSWHERMDTIINYEEDQSAMARIRAWKLSIAIANDRVTGGGFKCFSKYTYATYLEPVDKAFVAHSIYFDVIAQHGWPGMLMWMTILGLTWLNLNRVVARDKRNNTASSAGKLAKMLKLGMVAYLSGGAFLTLSFFDLPWHFIAIAYLLRHQGHPAFTNEPLSAGGESEPKSGFDASQQKPGLGGSQLNTGQTNHFFN